MARYDRKRHVPIRGVGAPSTANRKGPNVRHDWTQSRSIVSSSPTEGMLCFLVLLRPQSFRPKEMNLPSRSPITDKSPRADNASPTHLGIQISIPQQQSQV